MRSDVAGPRLIFAYRYGLLGGVSVQLLNRYPTFARAFDVRVIYERDHGIVRRFPAGAAFKVSTVAEQVDAIAQAAPEIFVVIDSPGLLRSWELAGSPGRLVVEVHTTTQNLAWVENLRLAHRIALFVTPSAYMARTLKEKGIDGLAPIRVVPNCLADAWFRPVSASWIPSVPIALWVGKLDGHKRPQAFIDLMRAVNCAPLVPVMVGGETAPGGRPAELLARFCADGRVVWLPRVHNDVMARLYAAVAACGGCQIVTSRNENFPMAVVESVMVGCPVVAPAVGGIPELLPPEALYPADDWDSARRLVERLLRDRRFAHELVAASRQIVNPLVRPERALTTFTEALDDAL